MIITVMSNEINSKVQTHPENGSNVSHFRDINPGLLVIRPKGDISNTLVISTALNRFGVFAIAQMAISAV